MKVFLSFLFVSLFSYCNAQHNYPKLELYAAPGFFLEAISNDSLVPAHQKSTDRIGDIISFAIQLALPLKNKRWAVKAGAGFSERHYSLSKYTPDDFFISLFAFDSPPRRDSFNLSHVRFTDNYFQIPVSFSYTLTRPVHNFQLAVGVNMRSDFLTKSKASVTFDSTYKIPTSSDIAYTKNTYASNASKFVCTAEPYFEGIFSVYKKLGLVFQVRPFSFYTTKLDRRLTTSTVELFSFTFGAFYSLK